MSLPDKTKVQLPFAFAASETMESEGLSIVVVVVVNNFIGGW